MQSPFDAYASNTDLPPAAAEDKFDTALPSSRERWQDVDKNVAEQGPHHFDATSTAAWCSDESAYRRPGSKPPVLERTSSMLARSSRNMSRLSKRFYDQRAATSETVKLAQEQQQSNRQNAAPVLKAVPSTRVGISSCKHA